MITRLLIAVSVALFFTPALPVLAQEHPEHPKKTADQPKKEGEHPKKGGEKEVTMAEISAGIKKHITSETKKSSDKKFHINYQGKDLALDLIKVHDDRKRRWQNVRHRFLHVGETGQHEGDGNFRS